MGTDHQSVQSVAGKVSCNNTALWRCTSTETLWNRKAPSLSSPEVEEIFLPRLAKSWQADVFIGPKVSTLLLELLSSALLKRSNNPLLVGKISSSILSRMRLSTPACYWGGRLGKGGRRHGWPKPYIAGTCNESCCIIQPDRQHRTSTTWWIKNATNVSINSYAVKTHRRGHIFS